MDDTHDPERVTLFILFKPGNGMNNLLDRTICGIDGTFNIILFPLCDEVCECLVDPLTLRDASFDNVEGEITRYLREPVDVEPFC